MEIFRVWCKANLSVFERASALGASFQRGDEREMVSVGVQGSV